MFVEKPRRETQRFEAGRDLKSENFVRSDGSSYESGASEHFQMEMILSSWKQDAVKNVSGFNLLLCCYQHKRCPSSQCTKSVYEADVKTLFVPTCGSMFQSFWLDAEKSIQEFVQSLCWDQTNIRVLRLSSLLSDATTPWLFDRFSRRGVAFQQGHS